MYRCDPLYHPSAPLLPSAAVTDHLRPYNIYPAFCPSRVRKAITKYYFDEICIPSYTGITYVLVPACALAGMPAATCGRVFPPCVNKRRAGYRVSRLPISNGIPAFTSTRQTHDSVSQDTDTPEDCRVLRIRAAQDGLLALDPGLPAGFYPRGGKGMWAAWEHAPHGTIPRSGRHTRCIRRCDESAGSRPTYTRDASTAAQRQKVRCRATRAQIRHGVMSFRHGAHLSHVLIP
jgi:hypothetical protein